MKIKKNRPPKWMDSLLEWFCSSRFIDEVQGDLHEWFFRRADRIGYQRARLYYIIDVIAYFRLFRLKRLSEMEKNNNMLLINYIKIAIRQFKRNFWYSTLNALGLTIGILSALLISLYVLDELSFDRFHEDHENIYRLVNHNPSTGDKGESMPSPWKVNMEQHFPEINEHTRLGQDAILVNLDGGSQLEEAFYWADANFTSFFSFEVLQGNPETMLSEPNGVVITKSKALRYFGDVDVVGREMPIKVYDGNKDFLMQVTGVLEDIPGNSHLQFDFLGSMSTTDEMYGDFNKFWGLNWLKSYVKLPPNTDFEALAQKVPSFFDTYRREGASEFSGMLFQPLKEVRLGSADISGNIPKGNMNYIYLFALVAILILVAASINYINLTTAKSSLRGKEVGMRKVFGAAREQVARQFYAECGFQLFIAVIAAFCMAMFLLPAFNSIVDKQMEVIDLLQLPVLIVIGGLTLLILIFSGFYPAIVMNRFQPVDVLRGNITGALGSKSWLRKLQVLVQFSIAAFLISSTLVAVNQMELFRTFDKGFNAEQLINIPVDDRDLQTKLMTIKQQMSQVVGVKSIAASGEALPSDMNNTWGFSWEGKETEKMLGINIVAVDYDYLETLETDLLHGRNLSKDLATDSLQACLINETAFKLTGWSELDGKKIQLDNTEKLVVGVISDFHYQSLHYAVQPAVYFLIKPGFRASPDNLIIRLNTQNLSTTLNELDKVWSAFSPQPFDFTFVDDSFAQLYGDEQKFAKLVIGFAIIGIFLSILGLVGLISFMADRHSKELSIRKVLGASRASILSSLGGQFALIFVIAMVIALPISKLVMGEWLNGFEATITIGWSIFLVAIAISLGITLLSIGSQAWKVAKANPVKYLSDH